MLKVITWNVNSINVRLERLLTLLKQEAPDVVCLQELKCPEEKFPFEAIGNEGYECLVNGQRTYNGVAILSKHPITLIDSNFGDGVEDAAARFIAAKTCGVNVLCAYVPNGQEVGSEKYAYKLQWLSRLRTYLDKKFSPSDPLVLVGDFNVAPSDEDVHDPVLWHEKILCSTAERNALRTVLAFGLHDTFRDLYPTKVEYTWWDYRQLAFPRNLGLRIDLILSSVSIQKRAESVVTLRDERKGEKPSDHAPVAINFHELP